MDETCNRNNEPTFIHNFAPDKVIGMINWRGRALVWCENSVWEISKDYAGFDQVQQIVTTRDVNGYTYREIDDWTELNI